MATIDPSMREDEINERIRATYYPGKPAPFVEIYGHRFEYLPQARISGTEAPAGRKYVENYKNQCRRNRIDYIHLNTSEPLEKSLMNYMIKRNKLI